MKIIDINKWFLRLLPAVVGFVAGCCIGVMWAVDKSYDTGYKMAMLEIQQLFKEGSQGNSDFYIEGIPFLFRPQKDRKASQIIPKRKIVFADGCDGSIGGIIKP